MALWYPSIPPNNQFLYDSSFPGKALPLTQYRPLIRVMFGGPDGSYLQYLTKITVTVSKCFVAGLDFQYEAPGSPICSIQACRGTTSADNSVKIPFEIDGPGGEILTGMQVKDDFWSPSQNGAVVALAVRRNQPAHLLHFQLSSPPVHSKGLSQAMAKNELHIGDN